MIGRSQLITFVERILIDNDMSKSPTATASLDFWNKGGFVLCTGGSAEIVINEQKHLLARGYLFMVTPLIQISSFEPSDDFSAVSFVSDLKSFYPVFRLIADTGIPLKVSSDPCWQLADDEISYVLERSEHIERKRSRLSEDISADERVLLSHHIRLICHETMLEVVGKHLGDCRANVDVSNHHGAVAYRFILALHENYNRNRSVGWYASEANLSQGHFATIIKAATGRNPSEWIATVTTTYAKLMLEQESKSIKQIAAELNFPEQFTFRKYFKQYAGVSPREYRRQCRAKR